MDYNYGKDFDRLNDQLRRIADALELLAGAYDRVSLTQEAKEYLDQLARAATRQRSLGGDQP